MAEHPAVTAKKWEVHQHLVSTVRAVHQVKVDAAHARVRAVAHAKLATALAAHVAQEVVAAKVAHVKAVEAKIAELKAAHAKKK
jgi:hypothetical protein